MDKNPVIVAPSILAGSHANLAESLAIIEKSDAEWVHLDIMDGHFVPNLTFGPQTVAELRKRSKLFFDVHLMLDNPDKFIEPFADAGADLITVHVEPDYPIKETLELIKEKGILCGISLNPSTPAEELVPYLEMVDLVLVMTVQPGYGGQAFREDVLPKIEQIAAWREEKGLSFRLEVDGGIDEVTGKTCVEKGADTLVAGTAFFKSDRKSEFLNLFF